jgi:hypothetical protein
MSGQAQQLQSTMEFFRVAGNEPAVAASAAKAARSSARAATHRHAAVQASKASKPATDAESSEDFSPSEFTPAASPGDAVKANGHDRSASALGSQHFVRF